MIPNSMKNKVTTIILFSFLFAWGSAIQAKQLLVYGDSLSAAYGFDLSKGWVSLLDEALGEGYSIANASISGETTSGGLSRLPLTLSEIKPDIVLLELGANDGLRGLPIKQIQANLEQMINLIKTSGAKVVIAGTSLPPSYGPRYIDQFRGIFTELANTYEVPFIDFFDEELFVTDGYIQSDGIHPTELAQPVIRDRILFFLKQQKVID